MTNAEIRALLERSVDPVYRAFSARLLPGVDDLLGVRLPVLRALAKKLARGAAEQYLLRASDASFEERLLQGLVLGYAQMPPTARKAALERFLPKIDNWSICDSTCVTCRFLRGEEADWRAYLTLLARDSREFYVRFALVCLLNHFIGADGVGAGEVLDICGEACHEGYYARMARAWAIAECAAHAPERALALLQCEKVDDFVRKAAIRKVIESQKIPAAVKARFQRVKKVFLTR